MDETTKWADADFAYNRVGIGNCGRCNKRGMRIESGISGLAICKECNREEYANRVAMLP